VLPREHAAGRRLGGLPLGRALEDLPVALRELLLADRRADRVRDLLVRRPDVAQVDVLAVLALADRILLEVDVERSGQRVGDDEGRRGEVVRARLRADAALEVAVAA